METKEKYSLAMHSARFPDNESCLEFLRMARWSGGSKCPQCTNTFNNYYLKSRDRYQCFDCRKQFNVLSGTVFEGSQVPLTKWFTAIYYFTTAKRGLSSVQLSKWLGITQKTSWIMLSKLRIALGNGERTILNGIVECDEMYINANPDKDMRVKYKKMIHDRKVKWRKKRYHGYEEKDGELVKQEREKGLTKRDRKRIKKQKEIHSLEAFGNERIVFGMTERNGNLVLKLIPAANGTEVIGKMWTHISDNATIMTDESGIYNDIWRHFSDHKKINHKRRKFCDGNKSTNSIENVFRHLRLVIRGTYCQRMENKHLQLYLDECSYRWNHRHSSEKVVFDSFFNKVSGMKYGYREITYEVGRMAA